MSRAKSIDFAKLIGFATVGDRLSEGVDLQDETFGDKLGAKVGEFEETPQLTKKVDYARLLGFEIIGSHLSDGIDFRDERFGDKLGAKVGTEIDDN